MKALGWLALSISILAVQPCGAAVNSITAVRHWSLSDVTRIIVEVSGDFEYRSDRLHDPERIYFDLLNARPHIQGQKSYTEHLDDPLVSRIRIALHSPEITRVVVDLNGEIDVTASRLSNPNRLIIELRKRTAAPQATPSAPPAETVSSVPAAPPAVKTPPPAAPPVKPVSAPAPVTLAKAEMPKPESPRVDVPKAEVTKTDPVKAEVSRPAISKPEPLKTDSSKADLKTVPGTPSGEIGRSARRTSDGQTSLVRALGLKLGRVVIDPGHGGHDQGTRGVHGLLEKDLVLDVAQRVGKLIEDKMGAEVIYTRTDDTFIPLEGRTAMANEKKADLFLSIHANSSPVPRIAGVETYYLNFTNSRDALDVASRENASSQKSIFELQDIIQKITQHDKAEESREFASRMQASIYSFSAHYFPAEKNRGVKKAPFVVLIGAHMPSILAEIGFLSNSREEALLKRPDYRQRLAEALFRGVQRYAETLSHFQVAQAKDE